MSIKDKFDRIVSKPLYKLSYKSELEKLPTTHLTKYIDDTPMGNCDLQCNLVGVKTSFNSFLIVN